MAGGGQQAAGGGRTDDLQLRAEGVSMSIRNDQDLMAWQQAMDLAASVYRVTSEFPREEVYGLRAQIRRAVVSIPSNIAEGQGRQTDNEFLRYLSIAHGSLREVETQTILAQRLGSIAPESGARILQSASEVGRLITGLKNRLRSPPNS
jgi:four helix bundle protein